MRLNYDVYDTPDIKPLHERFSSDRKNITEADLISSFYGEKFRKGLVCDSNRAKEICKFDFSRGKYSSYSCDDCLSYLEKINYEIRKQKFYNLVLADDSELSELKADVLNRYNELINNGEALDASGKVKQDVVGNMSFQSFVDNSDKEPFVREDSSVPYDSVYAIAKTMQTNIGNDSNAQFFKNIYEGMMTTLRQKSSALSNMPLEEFRDQQISLMKLSENEREKFKQDDNLQNLLVQSQLDAEIAQSLGTPDAKDNGEQQVPSDDSGLKF